MTTLAVCHHGLVPEWCATCLAPTLKAERAAVTDNRILTAVEARMTWAYGRNDNGQVVRTRSKMATGALRLGNTHKRMSVGGHWVVSRLGRIKPCPVMRTSLAGDAPLGRPKAGSEELRSGWPSEYTRRAAHSPR